MDAIPTYFRKCYIVLILLSFFCYKSEASHLMGGDLTFDCLGANQYRVNLTIYRDCNSNTSFDSVLELERETPGCGVISNMLVDLVSGYPRVITPLCETEVDKCDSFTEGVYGVEEFLYRGTFVAPNDCAEIIVGYADCCRNAAISTLVAPQQEQFYVGVVINTLDAFCNSSPKFNNNPTPFTCVGQEVNYNHGVTDDDGDDLVFSLVDCYDGYNTPVLYAGPYSGINPLESTGLTIDPITGAITFTPTALQVGILCVKVEEFRNGIKIGEIIRDIQFTVLNCDVNAVDENILPVLSGINGIANASGTTGDFQLDLCLDVPICFTMNGFDMDGHNLEITWNESIANASFSVANDGTPNAAVQFCWTPTIEDAGLNFFTTTILDDACDIRGVNTYTFTLNVSDGGLTYSYTQDSVTCFGGSDGAATISINEPLINPVFTWPTNPPQNGLTANNLSAGNYEVTVVDASIGCDFAVMLVDIEERTEIMIESDISTMDVSCTDGNDGRVEVGVLGGVPPYQYIWSTGSVNNFTNDLIIGEYTVTVTDTDGCTETTVFNINEPLPTVFDFQTSDYNGFGVSCTNGNDGSINVMPSGGVLPYDYLWSNGNTTEDIDNLTSGTYTLSLTDANGCMDSLEVFLNEPSPLIMELNNIATTCFESSDGSIIIEEITGAVPPYGWSLNGISFSDIDTFPIIIPNQTRGDKLVYISDAVNCIYSNIITVDSPDSLIVEIIPADTLVVLGEEIELGFITNSTDSFDFNWTSTVGFECDTCLFFNYQPLETTGFEISLIEKTNGCAANGIGIVRLTGDEFIFVPNAFTPNDDGFNDRLNVYAKANAINSIISFRIFDRWGGMVFQNENFLPNNVEIGWDGNLDGKASLAGVYVYALEVEYLNGEKVFISGDITLIR